MNADPRFARARLRAAWPALEAAGLSAARIAAAARHLGRARTSLEHATAGLLSRVCRIDDGHALLDGQELVTAPEEIGLRALAHLLMHISGRVYRPRFLRLEALFIAIREDQMRGGRTLHGCRIRPASRREAIFGPGTLRITPEAIREPRKG